MIRRTILAGLAAALLVPAQAGAGDLSLVLDRRAGAVELYLAGPTGDVLALFGAEADDGGGIDPDRWRLTGSFDFGDALLSGASVRIGGEPAVFEAMSVMVHPKSDPLPLRSPFDGLVAIAVCTASGDDSSLPISRTRLYAGYIAYTGATDGAIHLALPRPLARQISLIVRDHSDGRLLAVYRVGLGEGDDRLDLRPASAGLPLPAWLTLAALALNAVFAGAAIVHSRRRGATAMRLARPAA
jgi:hypothetical protein